MKKSKIILTGVCTASIFIGALSVYSGVRSKKLDSLKFTLPDSFTVTAHTGCLGTEDNSLESISVGAQNADIIEVDIMFAEDGTPVLAHSKVNENSVTLSQALSFVSESGVRANLDIKQAQDLSGVQSLIKSLNLTDLVFYTGIEEKDVEAVKKHSPDISYYLNADVDKKRNTDKQYLQSLADKVKELGAVGINLSYKGASKELVDTFHENGLLVSVWTVDGKNNIIRMLTMQVDNITSRKPDKVREIIEAHK